MESLLFGLIDNGILIITGYFSAFSLQKYLAKKIKDKKHNGVLAGLLGGAIGNSISDFVAGISLGWNFAFWVFIGCLIPMLMIPVLFKLKKSKSSL